jgi:hypothetical protein
MPILRIVLLLLAFASPALAQDGARDAAAAREAAQSLRVYVEGVAKKGERPDLTRPEIAAQLGRVINLDALNALPPVHGSDVSWLLDWMDAANTVNKLITRFGSKPGPGPDLDALQRNISEYENEYAATLNFQIRGLAREVISAKLFFAGLKPEERTPVRERGLEGLRSNSAEFILVAVCSVSASKPANARLVAAAVRDTREVWASFFLPKDRTRVIEQLAVLSRQVSDETARTDLATLTSALQAMD